MLTTLQLVTRFAQDHRDPRNIALHCWGVPMVVMGLALLVKDLSQSGWALAFAASGLLLQSLGHWYEGRRSRMGWAGWLAAPLFVGLQGLHSLGLAQPCWVAVERGAGARHLRDLARSTSRP
jgi:uncharacterized membrane protein YGL010W